MIRYDDAELKSRAPSEFAVATFVQASGKWEPLAELQVDPVAKTVSGKTQHLSPFAVASRVASGSTANACPPTACAFGICVGDNGDYTCECNTGFTYDRDPCLGQGSNVPIDGADTGGELLSNILGAGYPAPLHINQDGDESIDERVAGQIHGAHTAPAEQLDGLVAIDGLEPVPGHRTLGYSAGTVELGRFGKANQRLI